MKRAFRRGFTLVEVLISISLLGGLLAAAVAILFQVTSFWSAQADDPVFDRHADGLSKFLQAGFSSRPSTAAYSLSGFEKSSVLPVVRLRPPPDITWFGILDESGGRPDGVLDFEKGVGLTFRWRMAWGKSDGRALRTTVLSPLASAVSVVRYDAGEDSWREERPGDSASPDAFRFLRVELTHLGQHRTLLVEIPSDRTP